MESSAEDDGGREGVSHSEDELDNCGVPFNEAEEVDAEIDPRGDIAPFFFVGDAGYIFVNFEEATIFSSSVANESRELASVGISETLPLVIADFEVFLDLCFLFSDGFFSTLRTSLFSTDGWGLLSFSEAEEEEEEEEEEEDDEDEEDEVEICFGVLVPLDFEGFESLEDIFLFCFFFPPSLFMCDFFLFVLLFILIFYLD